ncbi:MAG: diaminopimelate epimerase [Coriobacteriales bacterium]|nr:diaminopimelate epimerase [Coriobacteriales bacterium]
MELRFSKMHGLGNDFVVIEDLAEEWDLSDEAITFLCDRHFGIGADGVIIIRPATDRLADFSWLFFNSDASVAEMCGNGIRCFAKYVVDRGLVPETQDHVVVETLVGLKPIEVTRDYEGKLYLATVDMGEPELKPAEVPTTLRCEGEENPVIACQLQTEFGPVELTAVSMGNPHAVVFVKDVDTAHVAALGPLIETDTSFPRFTNVEFAQVLDDERIRLRVWERGVGETLACGTGACATVVAAALTFRAGREAVVELPGGELAIRWAEDGHVYMTGPATEVFEGALHIDEDDEPSE